MSQGNFKGKYALITGASSGLGKALVVEYARRGCNIILVGRDAAKLSSLKDKIDSTHSGDHSMQICDLSSTDDIANMLLDSNFPNVDILVNADFDTFMEPEEVAEYVVFNSSFDGNLVSEELRLNRMFVQ